MEKSALNILLLGEHGVGKTSFCRNYLGTQEGAYTPTMGLDIYKRDVLIPGSKGLKYPIQLWDTGGSALDEKSAVNAAYEADVIILMYDITHIGSYERIRVKGGPKRDIRLPYTVLFGNKTDLEAYRTVTNEMHKDMFLEGRFYAEVQPSKNKTEWSRQWILSLITEFSGLQIDKKNVGPQLTNNLPNVESDEPEESNEHSQLITEKSNCTIQ